MNTFFTHLLIGSFALLCFLIGCGDTEEPSQSIDLTGKTSSTLAVEKTPSTVSVPAAPTAPGAGIPFVKEVGYYRDWKLTKPLKGTVPVGNTIFIQVVFSEGMKLVVADDKTARPILYRRMAGKLTRFRIATFGAKGEDFVSGDAKPVKTQKTYLCKYVVQPEDVGEFVFAVGKWSVDRQGNPLPAFYTHKKKLTLGVDVAPPTVTEVPQEQTPAGTAPTVLSVKHYLDDNATEEINADKVFVWAGTTLNTKIVFSEPVIPKVTYTTGNRTKGYAISKGVRGVHWRGVCKPTDKTNTVWLCKQSVSVPSFSVTVTTDTEDMAGTPIKASVQTAPIEVRPRPRTEPEPTAIPEPALPTEPATTGPAQTGSAFSGRVYDAVSERWTDERRSNAFPIAGVTVTIVSGPHAGQRVTTDQSGQYTFPNVTEDALRVRAEKSGFEPKEVVVYRRHATTIDGVASRYKGDPQHNPGNITIGHAWPDQVRPLLEQLTMLHDLLYAQKPVPYSGAASDFSGIVVVNASLEQDTLLHICAHEIFHIHQHVSVLAHGGGDIIEGWVGEDGSPLIDYSTPWAYKTPEGKAFVAAKMKDWVEVGKSEHDTDPYFYNSNTENSAETFAIWWSEKRIGRSPRFGKQKLQIEAPNRFRWVEEWFGK